MQPDAAAAELLRRRRARQSLAEFAQAIEVPGRPASDRDDEWIFHPVETQVALHHRVLMGLLDKVHSREIRQLMVFMPPGSAKALALDTPIPTPTGWTTMGALQVGDAVFDEQGQPCRVTWKSQVWKDRPVFTVRTDCGDEIVADTDHEWRVRLCGKRPVFKIKETGALAEQKRNKRPMIERAKALNLPAAELPIDPYLLGVWLGDGNSAGMRIASSVEDQPWLRGEIERLGYQTSDSSSPTLFGVLGVRAKFASLGLINDPAHATHGRKHIPASYLRGSRAQRLALLQGLIDTDGTVCRDRGCTTFCNTNLELAEGVRELVRSLGVKAGWSEGRAMLDGKDCGAVYRVGFYMKGSARMPRKASMTRDQQRTPDTYIEFEAAPRCDTVCIEVDSPSHLFLCGRSMTPTHNSTYTSVVYPAYAMARRKGSRFILASYASQIAWKQSRRTRQIVRSGTYRPLFGTGLVAGNQSVEEWALENGSEYMAGGLLAGMTGNRATDLIIDDPVAGRDEADSETLRKRTREAYEDDLSTRLMPGGTTVIIQCMTGDTPVLMSDGGEKPLRDVRPGDLVATFEDGAVGVSTVQKWQNNGPDSVFEIRMKSGAIVRANARHPFLVDNDGVLEWQRTAAIKKGSLILRAIGASGEASGAQPAAASCQPDAKACACRTTTNSDGRKVFGRLLSTLWRGAKRIFDTATALIWPNISACSKDKAACAPCAKNRPPSATPAPIGMESFASITATTASGCGACCATTAISLSATGKHPKPSTPPLSTYAITRDEVVEVVACGVEDVFDVQIDRTENFIANGLVSHNTRWHQDDLSGGILPVDWDGESGYIRGRDGLDWFVLRVPAIADRPDDPLGRKIGERLWPEWFTPDHFERFRANPRTWNALFQQRPTADEGTYFRAEWFEDRWDRLPPNLRKFGWSDYAVTPDGGDFTEMGVFGLDESDRLYVLDWWHGQTSSDQWIERQCDLIYKHQPLIWGAERGVIARSVSPYLTQRMRARRLTETRLEWLTTTGDKTAMARGAQAMASMGSILFPRRSGFADRVIAQLCAFPAGSNDDAVDVLGGAVRAIPLVGRPKPTTRIPSAAIVDYPVDAEIGL